MKTFDTFQHEEIQGFKFGYHPFGQPRMHAHVYFIDGLLIDTGQRKLSRLILEQLGQLPVKQIMATHFHEDHTGNIDLLQKHFNCPVYASPACCEIMKAPPPISFAQKISWGNRPAYTKLSPITESISTPNYQFRIIPVPGHAPDMVALYEPKKKWLFSSDLYVHHYIRYILPEESIQQQIDSIKQVLELDFDILLCGHNPQLKNGKALLAQKLAFLEEFFESVAQQYQKGLEAKEILQTLGLKEDRGVKFLSGGNLSTINMVKSVIRDLTVLRD